jgi:hypothetical protein
MPTAEEEALDLSTPPISFVRNCLFTNCSSLKTGGAIFVYNSSVPQRFQIKFCVFLKNVAFSDGGGSDFYFNRSSVHSLIHFPGLLVKK